MKILTSETFPPTPPCPVCNGNVIHKKTRLGYYCDSICNCNDGGILIINGEPEKISSCYSKIVSMYDVINTGLNILWNKLPRWVQSALICGLWILIPGTLIYQLLANQMSIREFPLAMFAIIFTFLGIFYIIMELKGELKKK